METKKVTSKEYFKAIRIVHIAMIIGLVFYATIITTLFLLDALEQDDALTNIFLLVLVPMLLIGLFGSRIFFRSKLMSVRSLPNLPEKLDGYRSALIIKFALIEAPSLFSIIVFQLTGNLIFLGFAGFMIFYFIIIRPSISNAIIDLELNPEDSHKLNDPEAIITEWN